MEVFKLFATLGLNAASFNQGLDDARGQLDETGGAGAAFGKALKRSVIGATVAAGTAITGFATAAVLASRNFEQDMAKVYRNIGNTSGEMEQELEAGVRRIAAQYGVSAAEVAGALSEYAYAGLSVEDALDSLEAATRGSIAADADLGSVLTQLDGIFAAFKGQGYETAEVMDVLTSLASNANGGFDKLSAAMVTTAPAAVQAGVSLEEAGAAIGALTWMGVPASEAATQIRTALNELGNTTSKVGTRFSEVTGQSFANFIASGGTLEEAIALLNANLQEGETISQLFGSTIAGNAISTISAGEGADYYSTVLESLTGSMGSTDTAFDRMSGTMDSKLSLLRARFFEVSLALGEKLAPAFTTLLDAVLEIMPTVQEVIQNVFDGIGAGVAWVIDAWNNLESHTGEIWPQVQSVIDEAVKGILLIFEFLAALWESILKPAWDALAPYLKILWDTVVDIIKAAWQAIQGILNLLIGLLTGDWERAWEGAKQIFTAVWDAIVAVLRGAWSIIETLFLGGAGTVERIMNNLAGVVKGAWESIKSAFSSAVDHFKIITDGIQRNLQLFIEFIKAIFRGDLTAALGVAREMFENWWTTINDFFGGLPAKMLEFGKNLIGGLVDGVKSMLTNAVDAVKGVGENIINGFKGLLGIASPSKVFHEFGVNIGHGLANGIKEGQTKAVEAVKGMAEAVVTAGRAIIRGAFTPAAIVDAVTHGLEGADAAKAIKERLEDLSEQRGRLFGARMKQARTAMLPVIDAQVAALENELKRLREELRLNREVTVREGDVQTRRFSMAVTNFGNDVRGVTLAKQRY